LPFVDIAFDLTFMGLLLHETDDTLAVLKEACRVTQKRLAILECLMRNNLLDHPLSTRLPSDKIAFLAQQAGFSKLMHSDYKTLCFTVAMLTNFI
jgi:ubiquinone/menaquinone biosynthesis C-methylase UbiE